MFSWARRSLAVATIFMALVICWVERTLAMRLRMSRRLAFGMAVYSALNFPLNSSKISLIFFSSSRVNCFLLPDFPRRAGYCFSTNSKSSSSIAVPGRSPGTYPGDPFVPAKMIRICFSTGQGPVLGLFENLHQPASPGQLGLGGLIQIAAELGEGGHLPVLGQVQPKASGDLFHGLDLGIAPDAGDGKTHVDGRPDSGIEEFRLQVNLPVGDGDHVRGDVGGNVACLGLDDRQGRQATRRPGRHASWPPSPAGGSGGRRCRRGRPPVRGGGAGEGRAADRPWHVWTGRRRCRGRAFPNPEILSHGAAAVRGDVLHGGRVGGRGGHDRGIFHGSISCAARRPRGPRWSASGRWPRRSRKLPCLSG